MSDLDMDPTADTTITQVPSKVLQDLLDVAKDIRDLLSVNVASKTSVNETTSIHERPLDNVAVLDVNLESSFDIAEAERPSKILLHYRRILSGHKLECEKTLVELRCFATHLECVGGNEYVIKAAQELGNILLNPLHALNGSLGTNSVSAQEGALRRIQYAFREVREAVYEFSENVDGQTNVLHRIKEWDESLSSGWKKIIALKRSNKLDECMEYVHYDFLPRLEGEMCSVVEALESYEESSVTDWLDVKSEMVEQDRDDKYIKHALTSTGLEFGEMRNTRKPEDYNKRCSGHIRACDKMWVELNHTIEHYGVVRGDVEVIESAKLVQKRLFGPVKCLTLALSLSGQARTRVMKNSLRISVGELYLAVKKFRASLYHQKHAFYFREVKLWLACLLNGFLTINEFIQRDETEECVDYVCYSLLPTLESAMIGVANNGQELLGLSETHKGDLELRSGSLGNVAEELKTFGDRSLPNFLVDEMERDTTRFVNITTIATFFSSVTATTLQFTYQPLGNETSEPLRGVVNLFWFVSLVFSVSSGVSSLLGLTWRKSSIYDSRKPPKPIRLWFDKAPMVFLIIAAVAFVIGLNLFAYLSVQPHYVSLTTNIFTGLHGTCLLAVTLWLIYQLKHESFWAGWIRIGSKPVIMIGKRTKGWISTPFVKFKRNLHLRRNIYWALRLDSRVLRITRDMDWEGWNSDWPDPYLLSRIVRFITYPIKKSCMGSTKVLSSVIRLVKRSPSTLGNAGLNPDVESGKRKDAGEGDTHILEDAVEDPVKKAATAYCAMLLEVFHESWLEGGIMWDIEIWQDGSEQDAEKYIRRLLWGYPDLVQRFHEDVRPALVAARDMARKDNEKDLEHQIIDAVPDEGAEVCALGADANERSPGPTEQSIGDHKGREPALEPDNVIYSDRSGSRLVGGQAEVQAQTDNQLPSSEGQHRAPTKTENGGDFVRDNVRKTRVLTDGIDGTGESPLAEDEIKRLERAKHEEKRY